MPARLLMISVLLLNFLGCVEPCLGEELSWQTSSAVSTELTIRDKYGALGQYEAVFKVKSTKDSWEKKVLVQGADWASVRFPDDFTSFVPNGLYHWECLVQGKTVLSGAIDYRMDSGVTKMAVTETKFGGAAATSAVNSRIPAKPLAHKATVHSKHYLGAKLVCKYPSSLWEDR